jgi:hypothetical protein
MIPSLAALLALTAAPAQRLAVVAKFLVLQVLG